MMKRDEVIAVLMAHQEQLKNFRVKSLALFGSFAREEATPESDVDLLVEFDSPVGLFTFMRLQRYLQTILGRSVDLGTPDSLKNYLKEAVLKEAVRAI
jgi:predicted nucleotidyltransferase